jgi:hypothetical protein
MTKASLENSDQIFPESKAKTYLEYFNFLNERRTSK